MSPAVARQGASAFNQPLSLNTSGVTDMSQMFEVRFGVCHGPCVRSGPPCMLRTPPPPPRPPKSRPVSPSVSPAVTRQGASAFNQPLSLVDTSKVTTMYGMFYVRPPRVPLPPNVRSSLPCTSLRAPPRPHALSPLAPRRPP